jgi:capsular exopolysaccharide synthesis family protein
MIFIDDRLRGGDMVPEKLGMNYLGSLSTNAEVKAGTIPTSGKFAQQVADIGVNLRLTNVLPGTWHAPQGNVLLVTSAQIAEGKTTTVAALAGSLARGGYSVLVIDGDVHNPSTHLAFGITPASFGLSGLLKSTGAENLDAAVQRTNLPGVWLLAGGSPTEEGTILLEQKMPAILAQLRMRTDIILIDSPALLSSADASILATLVDGITMVVDFRYDKIKLLLRARDILRSVAQKPMGVIINHMPMQKRNPFYTVTYTPDEAATNYAGAQTYSSNGNGHDTGNGQRLEPSSSPNYNAFSVPSSPSRPTPAPAMPMDFPVMQPNPNPPSTFPSPRRMDMTPPQS